MLGVMNKKEKRMIVLIVTVVVITALIAITMYLLQSRAYVANVGAAIHYDNERPTVNGFIQYLSDSVRVVNGDGSCDVLCGEKICYPVDDTCSVSKANNRCFCYEVPQ